MRWISLMLAVIALGIASCGGGGGNGNDGPSQTSDVPNEDALADSLLLEVSDFPSGWAEEPPADEGEEDPFEECTPDMPGRTGRAESGDFSRGGSATIAQSIVVYVGNAEISAALDQVPANAQCSIDLINDGDLDDSEFAYSDASLGSLSFPKVGDRTESYRLKVHVDVKGESGIGSEGDIFYDAVYVTVGRVGISIFAFDTFTPFSASELEEIVSVAVDKVERLGPR